MKKKFISTFFLIFLLGFTGTVISPPQASAGFFEDLFNRFVPKIFTPSETKPPASPDSGSKESQIPASVPTPAPAPIPVPVIPYAPTLDYEEAVIKAVEDGSKSVVSIVISKYVPILEQCPYDPFSDLPPDTRQLFGGLEFSRPCQKGTKLEKVGGGSGFIVSGDGLILTNKHVVSDSKAEYTVITYDGKKYDGKIMARDPVQDLAIIKISATGLKPARLGNSDSIKLGQTAIAIGYSLGEFSNTVSVGAISGLARTITASGGGFGTETIQGVIQTDAAINPGNSGGPLLNLKGEVIGVNTAVVSGAQSIGFAIPINQAKRDIQSVKGTGTIKIPYLGVSYVVVTPEFAAKENLPVSEGALVRANKDGVAVLPNSPASKAGVQPDDIILEINKEKISSDKPLGNIIQKYNIGDIVTIKLRRGENILELKATLEERPEM